MAVVERLAEPDLAGGVAGGTYLDNPRARLVPAGHEHPPRVDHRPVHVLVVPVRMRVRPEQPAGPHVDTHDRRAQQRDELPHAPVRYHDGRAVGHAVRDGRVRPGGPAGGPVERDDATAVAARGTQDQVVLHEDVLGQAPRARPRAEDLGRVDGPEFLARLGLEGGQAARRPHVIQGAIDMRGRSPRARRRAAPTRAVRGLPEEPALEVERDDVLVGPEIAGGIDPPAGHRHAGVPPAGVGEGPGERRPALGPLREQARFGGHVVAAGPVELRPEAALILGRRRGSGAAARAGIPGAGASSGGGRQTDRGGEHQSHG